MQYTKRERKEGGTKEKKKDETEKVAEAGSISLAEMHCGIRDWSVGNVQGLGTNQIAAFSQKARG